VLTGFAGIYYRPKYGHDIENWALFEWLGIVRELLGAGENAVAGADLA
jgi:hypothetical protein